MAEVSVSNVSKSFGATRAVRDLSLTIADGEFVALLGPTGAGKTTTLRLVAGLEKPESGTITIGGLDATHAPPAARDVTFVFQQYSLYPHLTVFENLAFPLRSPTRRTPEEDIRRIVNEVATMLRIETKLGNKATQLSGGQMQRVAIGRALVRRPAIALMDEPLSSLDAKLRSDLRVELKRIQRELRTTILYVTHDQMEAMTMADRIGVLEGGRLVQVGTPREIYENPVSAYVASRLGQPAINLIPRAILGESAVPPETATIGIRTEHMRLLRRSKLRMTSQGDLAATVRRVEHLGDQNHLHLAIGEHEMVMLADPTLELQNGEIVDLSFVNPLFFNSEGARIS
ncbi:MAG: ABC transporter ATP-binding protein [Rhizobiales bacterium]|nr:ABC transporter ATP-binding protein [Hyphomicrobiales bacterium]